MAFTLTTPESLAYVRTSRHTSRTSRPPGVTSHTHQVRASRRAHEPVDRYVSDETDFLDENESTCPPKPKTYYYVVRI